MTPAGIKEVRPYLGLRYYEENDAPLFYGRDEHVAELLGKVAQNRFVAILGSSGSGKSSLVRAGLLPELRSGMIPSAGSRWKVVEFKPGRAPLTELAQAITRELGVVDAQSLVEEGPLGIAKAVAGAALDKATNVLVIADQFEEVFRFQREETNADPTGVRGKEAAEQCQALARRLLDAAVQTELPIYVLLAMRSDYLGECAQFPDLPERMSESLYLVPRLRRDQLQEAITAPVGGAIDPAVVQRLLGEVGSDSDQLPRLEHLLARMWDKARGGRLTMQHYTDAGGWDNGLEQHLEEVYSALTATQKTACAAVFQQLSELDRGRAVRRRASVAELNEVCGPDAEGVVKAFREAGFLSAVKDPVDITHECILREWHRLREWLERENLKARRLRELSEAAIDAGYDIRSNEQKASVGGLEGLTLQNLLDWRDKSKPTDQWAQRYLPVQDYESAIGYLAWSEARDKRQKKAGRRLNMFFVGMIGVLFVWAVVLAYVYYHSEAEVRISGLPGYAAAFQNSDPARALYLGSRYAQTRRSLPVGLVDVLETALGNGASYGVLRGHAGSVTGAAINPDGEIIASSGADGTIRLWDSSTARELTTLAGHKGGAVAVVWRPDGKFLASAGSDQTIRIWTYRGTPTRTLDVGHQITSIAWKPGSNVLAVGIDAFMNKGIQLWDTDSGKLLSTLGDMQTLISGLAWSPDAKTLAAVGRVIGGGSLLLCGAADCQPHYLEGGTGEVTSVAWSFDGKSLALGCRDLTVRVLDVASSQNIRVLQSQGVVYSLAWSHDGTSLASAGEPGSIQLWRVSDGAELNNLQGHTSRVTALSWNAKGSLASSSQDGTIRIWMPAAGQELRSFAAGEGVHGLDWRSGSTMVVTAGSRGISLWDTNAGTRIRTLHPQMDVVSSVAFSPDGTKLAASTGDGAVWLWLVEGWKMARTWKAAKKGVPIAWAPDNSTLACGGDNIGLWAASDGRLLRSLNQGPIMKLAWSGDGRLLASIGTDSNDVQLSDVSTGSLRAVLRGTGFKLVDIAWNRDGKTIATAGGTATGLAIRLWDAASQRPIRVIHNKSISLAWNPDGTLLASATEDGIQLVDVSSGQVQRTLRNDSVVSIAWSKDGKTLASADVDGLIQLWPGGIDTLLAQVRDRIKLFTLSQEDCQRYFGSNTCPPIQ